MESDGWLWCGLLRRHSHHRWAYADPATGEVAQVFCDGASRPEPEGRCCGDPLCPCDSKPGWSTETAGSMNYSDLEET